MQESKIQRRIGSKHQSASEFFAKVEQDHIRNNKIQPNRQVQAISQVHGYRVKIDQKQQAVPFPMQTSQNPGSEHIKTVNYEKLSVSKPMKKETLTVFETLSFHLPPQPQAVQSMHLQGNTMANKPVQSVFTTAGVTLTHNRELVIHQIDGQNVDST